MSDQIPVFKVGERCQPMGTMDNFEREIAGVCGVVKAVDLDGCYGGFYTVELEGRPELVKISGCSLRHVSKDLYNRWQEKGIDTSKAWELPM